MANEILTKNLAIGMMPYGDMSVYQLFIIYCQRLTSTYVSSLVGGACDELHTLDSTVTSCLHTMIYNKSPPRC